MTEATSRSTRAYSDAMDAPDFYSTDNRNALTGCESQKGGDDFRVVNIDTET